MTIENPYKPEDDLLEAICPLYGISINDLKLIVAVDNNFMFEFQQNGRGYILRGGIRHSADLVRAELDWILHLHASGVKVSLPVSSKNNNYLELIAKGDKVFNVVVFEKAPGKQVDIRNPEEWTEDVWAAMGNVMGRMHAAAMTYKPESSKYRRRTYYEDDYAHPEKYLDPVEDAIIFQKFSELKEKFRQLPQEPDSYGLIHYDFHLDNFNIDRGKITVFDFDDCHYFFFLYDLATAFHETIWDHPVEKRQEFADRFIPRFWKAYSEEFQLDRKWLAYLPVFFKWRELTIYVCMIKDYIDEKTPEWLRARLPPWIAEFRDYIVNDTQIVDIPEDLRKWFPEC